MNSMPILRRLQMKCDCGYCWVPGVYHCDRRIANDVRHAIKERWYTLTTTNSYIKMECYNKEDVDNFKSFFTPEELKYIVFTRIF